jgi:hypothetical protein
MKAVVGVFPSPSDAERSAAELGPEVRDKKIAAVPSVAGEPPGVGVAMEAVVGGRSGRPPLLKRERRFLWDADQLATEPRR